MKRISIILVILVVTGSLLAACDLAPKEPDNTVPTNPTIQPAEAAGEWHYLDLPDPNAPNIVESSPAASSPNTTFRIKPDWQLASVEYVDASWGLGDPALHDQIITRVGPSFTLGSSTLPDSAVQAIVTSLDNLRPTQMLMQGHAWADDYPSWSVELVGKDGQHVLLFASSTGNPGNGPWTILYNGRLYAQYTGDVATPLGNLFGGRLGRDNTLFINSAQPNEVNFSTIGLPPQLTYGFYGLLPISEGFSYTADASTGTIKGQIADNTPTGNSGNLKLSQITGLTSLTLSTPDSTDSPISCTIQPLPAGSASPSTWEFNCPVANSKPNAGPRPGDPYRYSITVRFSTETGTGLETSGQLFGKWRSQIQRDYLLLPPPAGLALALAANPAAADLLTDHIIGASRYSASFSADNPLLGRRTGEVILFGQTQLGTLPLRYTIGVQFALQNGSLIYWDLDRAALNSMLQAVVSHPLTARALAADPHTVLNMWYTDSTSTKPKTGMLDYGVPSYATQISPCGSIPGGNFPSPSQPFQSFDFNSTPYFDIAPFILINDQPVISELTIYPDSLDPVQKVLLPDSLNTGGSQPFNYIYANATPFNDSTPTIHIRTPFNADPAETAVYSQLLKSLTIPTRTRRSEITLPNATLAVLPNGKLQPTPCSP